MPHDPRRQTTRPTTVTRGGESVNVARRSQPLRDRLGLKPRAGFFGQYETAVQRLRRESLFKRSKTRLGTQRVLDASLPSLEASQLRRAQETFRRAGEDRALGQRDPALISVGARVLNIARKKREELEKRQQDADISAARTRLKEVESRQRPLTEEDASDLLHGRREVPLRVQLFRDAKLTGLDKYLPVGVKLNVTGKNEARFNEEAGTVEVSKDILKGPGAAGTVAHEGGHARIKTLVNSERTLRSLRVAFNALPDDEKDELFGNAQKLMNQEGQGTRENRYQVGGEEEIYADAVAVAMLKGSEALPPGIANIIGRIENREAEERRRNSIVAARRFENQFRRQDEQSERFNTVPPRTPLEALDRTGLEGDERELVLREMSRRGEDNTSIADVQRFAANVMFGREPGLSKGEFIHAQGVYEPQAGDDQPSKTTVGPNGFPIPLTLPTVTAKGRLLESWKVDAHSKGWTETAGSRQAALKFDEMVGSVKDTIREELINSGLSEARVDAHLDGFLERELRRAELFAQATAEWQDQNPRTKRLGTGQIMFRPAPNKEEEEEITRQVNEAIAEEFDSFNAIAEFRDPGALGKARDIAGSLPGPAGRIGAASVGGLEMVSAVSQLAAGSVEQLISLAPARVIAVKGLKAAGIPIPDDLEEFLTMTPTGSIRAIGRLTGIEALEQVEASPLATVMNLAKSEEERRARISLGTVGDAPFLGEELEKTLPDLLIGLESGGMLTSILPKEVLDASEQIPYFGPSIRRELDLLTSPLGLASFLVPGFAQLLLVGAVGGIAAGGTTRILGVGDKSAIFGLSVEETAQIVGNVLMPGAGLVPLRVVLKGPLRPVDDMIKLYNPGVTIREVKPNAAQKIVDKVTKSLEDDTVDLGAVLGPGNFLATNMQSTMGTRGLAFTLASNLLTMGVPASIIHPLLVAATRVARLGPAALKTIPKAIQENRIFKGMVMNLRAGEAGGAGLRESLDITTYTRAVRNLLQRAEEPAFKADVLAAEKSVASYAKAVGKSFDELLDGIRATNKVPRDFLTAGGKTGAEKARGVIGKLIAGGEEGGIRITKDGVRLTPKTERVLALSRDGQPLTRKEVLEAAAAEGISTSGKRQTISTEALINMMKGKKAMWERLLEVRKVISDAPRPSRQVLDDAATVLAKGPKATLKELQQAANQLGIRQAIAKIIVKPVKLTKKEIVELGKLRSGERLGQLLEKEVERLAELETKAAKFAAGVDEKKIFTREIAGAVRKGTGEVIQDRAFADNMLASPGELIGTLSRIRQRSVWEALEDIAAGRFTTGELTNIRRDVEMELRRVGKNADDVLASGEWASLGRRGGRVFEDTSMTTSEGGVFKLRAEAVEEADKVARGKVFAEGPVRDMMETADNIADFGVGRGGVGKGPPRPLDGAPSNPDPLDNNMFREIKTMEEFAIDTKATMENMMGGFARQVGKLPPGRAVIGMANPSPYFEGKVGDAMLGFLGKQNAINNFTSAIETKMHVAEKGLFKFKDNIARGLLSRTGKAVTPEHIIQSPEDIFRVGRDGITSIGDLTPKQMKFINEVRSSLDQMRAFEKFMGVEVKEFGEEMGRYFPRKVVEAESLAEKKALIDSLGEKQVYEKFFQKDRQYTTMWEGMTNGVRYGEGITQNVVARIRAGQMAALDRETAKFLGDKGLQRQWQSMINEAEKGVNLPGFDFVETINNFARPMVTNIDLGFFGLQLVPAFFRNPPAALRGALMGLDSLFTDGRLYAGYIRKQMDDGHMQRFFNAGGIWNQSEFSFEFLAKGGGWGAKALSSKPLGIPIGPFMNRFGGAYTNALNVATLETFKGMVGVNDVLFRLLGNRRATALITEAFGGFKISGKSSEQMAASVANKLTLRTNAAVLGVGRSQSQLERFAFFAPGYYRAMFGLLGDSIQGGLRGAEARRSLGQMMIGFLGINMALEEAFGFSVGIDPREKDFMLGTIGALKVGVGGPFVSLMRLAGKSVTENHEGELIDIGLPFGLGLNPDLLQFDVNDNPIFRWGRGKMAPVASLIADELDGQTFMFDKLDSPMDHLENIARRFTPFFAQAGVEAYNKDVAIKDVMLASGLEFIAGARTFPVGAFDIRNDARNEGAKKLYPKIGNYKDLNEAQQAKVRELEEVKEADAAADKEALERDFEGAAEKSELAEAMRQYDEDGVVLDVNGNPGWRQFTTQTEDDGLFARGELEGQDWIARFQDRQKERATFYAAFKLAKGIAFVGEVGGPVDQAIDAYFEVKPEQFLDSRGEPDWDAYFLAKDGKYLEAVKLGGQDVGTFLRPIETNETVRIFREVQDKRRELKELPKYRFLDVEGSAKVDELLEKVKVRTAELREQGIRISHKQFLKNILLKLPRDHPMYTVVAVAFMRRTDKKDLVWNPDRDQVVLDNPAMVKYYISTWTFMSDENKLKFLDLYGTQYFSNQRIIDEGLESVGRTGIGVSLTATSGDLLDASRGKVSARLAAQQTSAKLSDRLK